MPDLPSNKKSLKKKVPSTPPPITNRLTIVEHIYHQQGTNEPQHFPCSYSRVLNHDEQPYERRRQVATEEWKPLDLGWIKSCGCGLLKITNHEGTQPSVIPTPQEAQEIAARVLEICYEGSEETPWLIDPKECTRLRPSKPEGLKIRCQAGQAVYSFCAFPC